jgi:hypothetical protein
MTFEYRNIFGQHYAGSLERTIDLGVQGCGGARTDFCVVVYYSAEATIVLEPL